HPFSDPATQVISPDPRYQRLVDEMQWPARQMQIFGIHVHVGVRSGEKAIAMVNALSAYIPHFLALSASSPYWMGHDTGLASCRSKVFEGLPTAGPPWQLTGWAQFERLMDTLIAARSISSIREVWWDIRPHPGFGTVELRICDGIPTLREIGVVAALGQCLVQRFDTLLDRGYSLPTPRAWLVRENKWRAARYGLDAAIVVDEAGTTVSLREAIAELVEDLMPVAMRLDCSEELHGAVDVMERGPSYIRQREVVAGGGSLRDVVDSLVEELRTDRPASR
ncbi:MAG: glutamate--cysteine ligase, partial [Chloroflexi bacterium]